MRQYHPTPSNTFLKIQTLGKYCRVSSLLFSLISHSSKDSTSENNIKFERL